MRAPEKGDVIMLNFEPSVGKEIMKRRPALVISRKIFNEHTGFAIVAPITNTKRGIAMEVELPADLMITGAVLVHQLRSLDWKARQAEFVESVPTEIIDRVTAISNAIIS